MRNIKSNQLRLALQTKGGAYSYWAEDAQCYRDGRLEADPLLVKTVAKEILRKSISQHDWGAMFNSKLSLRRAAISGDFRDLPEWLRLRIAQLYRKMTDMSPCLLP